MQNLKRCRLQNQPKPLILLSKKEWKMHKIVLFKVNFLDDFSHNDFYFFFQYHSVCQRWTFFRRVIISKNQGDLLENTNWS